MKRSPLFSGKIIFLIMLPVLASAEEKTAAYAIKHNGNVIGHLVFYRKTGGREIFLKMDSSVKTRFIFGIDVKTSDRSHFRDGVLINSLVSRSINGKEKENKKTSLVDEAYQIRSGTKTRKLDGPITYNMMMLYCKEPLNISDVYSDNFQQFMAIKPIGNHAYRINLPDGNYNDYYFQNGICRLVEVHHPMYTIKMELINRPEF